MPSDLPIYLETALGTCFGIFQAPALGASPASAVLICAPWGWDEVASYRSRKRWAKRLAAAGHPTLRFDFPATGESDGTPSDPARLDSWLAAVEAAAGWLRKESGAPGTAALGLGLGGLLARAAIARGAPVEELVLWGSPPSGKAFVREVRAFSRMQPWSGDAGRAEKGEAATDGAIEAGGFVLSAETIAALKGLDPDDSEPSHLRRALLLDRDGVAVDERIGEAMESAGVEVARAPGEGWGLLVGHPERSRLPHQPAGAVEAWLADGRETDPPTSPASDGASVEARDALRLERGDRAVREAPWSLEQPFGRVFGVLAEPVSGPVANLCAVFLNAGAVRNTGPNRMWVETARRWAGRGVPTLRVDLEGIGEADGDETVFEEVSEFYIPRFEEQVVAVLDALEERNGGGRRYLLVGLCAGGYWSYRTALHDRRVGAAILLNAGALDWYPDVLIDRAGRKLARVLRRRLWRKLLKGEISAAQVATLGRSLLKKAGRLAQRPWRALAGRGATSPTEFDREFDRLRDQGTRLTMAFSADEDLLDELRAVGIAARLESWPNVELEELPGADHTLRSLPAQLAARELLDRELERALEPAAAPAVGLVDD